MQTKNLALTLSAVLLWGWFIWPGPWHYDKIEDQLPIRTHRVTGKTQYLIAGEWTDIGGGAKRSEASSNDTIRMLDVFEAMDVSGRGGVDWVGYFKGDIHNGTPCRVTRIVYTIREKRGSDTIPHAFSNATSIESRTTTNVIFQAGIPSEAAVGWGIDSVEASCPKVAIRR